VSRAKANNITLEYESLGDNANPTILLIMGLGMQMTAWPDAFCEMLVARGFHVLRFDNRDAGLSSGFEQHGVPNLAMVWLKYLFRRPLHAPYSIDDMADDTAALLDVLCVKQAHIVGASMGGMIAQNLAARYPGKVLSLTSMMSTTGRRGLPGPARKVRNALMRPAARDGDVQGAVQRLMKIFRAIGSPGYPEDEALLRAQCERHVLRAYRPGGMARQLFGIVASGDRTQVIKQISVPTLVLHGAADPLVPLACGKDTAAVIPNARLTIIEGMGHDLPGALLPRLVQEIATHCLSVAGKA
jgi:proline iminopeptidase